MSQRLGVAAALIGDPGVLLLDEPVNGLDPEGILWIRTLLRRLADEGRTILVSSHLMSEMALTADHVLVIGRGRLIADTSVDDLIAGVAGSSLRIVSPDADDLRHLLVAQGADVVDDDAALLVTGVTGAQVGELARDRRLAIYEMAPQHGSLEEAFMALTKDSVEFTTPTTRDERIPA